MKSWRREKFTNRQRRQGMSAYTKATKRIRDMLRSGHSNAEIWEVLRVMFNFPESRAFYPAWYRKRLQDQGEDIPSSVEARKARASKRNTLKPQPTVGKATRKRLSRKVADEQEKLANQVVEKVIQDVVTTDPFMEEYNAATKKKMAEGSKEKKTAKKAKKPRTNCS